MPELNAPTDRRIAVLAVDGFEKVALTIPVAALKMAGADVDIVSPHAGRIRGVNLHEPASMVRVDKALDRASPVHIGSCVARRGAGGGGPAALGLSDEPIAGT
jgi:protease I